MIRFFKNIYLIAILFILMGCNNNPDNDGNKTSIQIDIKKQEQEEKFIKNCNEKLAVKEKFFLKYWWGMTSKEFDYISNILVNEGSLVKQDSSGKIKFVFFFEPKSTVGSRTWERMENDSIVTLLAPNFLNDTLIGLKLNLIPIQLTKRVENQFYEGYRDVNYYEYRHREKLFEIYKQKYGNFVRSPTYQYIFKEPEGSFPFRGKPFKVHTGYEYKWKTNQGYVLINSIMIYVHDPTALAFKLAKKNPLFRENDEPESLSINYLSPHGYQLYILNIQEKEERLNEILNLIESEIKSKTNKTKESI